MTSRTSDNPNLGGCAVVPIDTGNVDQLFVLSEPGECAHIFSLAEIVQAGLVAKLSPTYCEADVKRAAEECIADLQAQIDDLRKMAKADSKLAVFLQDCAFFDFENLPHQLVSLAQVGKYICEVNAGKFYHLFERSRSTVEQQPGLDAQTFQ